MNAHRRPARLVLLGVLLAFVLGAAPAHAAVVLADSYPVSNFTGIWPVYSPQSQFGQSFTAVGGALDSAVFNLSKNADSAGNAYALLYAHSGTFGVDGVPTGTPLATSSPVDATTLGTLTGELVTFHFDNTVTLTEGEKYVIVLQYTGAWPNPLNLGFDGDSPTHEGNAAKFTDHWEPYVAYDNIFYVYQTPTTYRPVYRFYNKKNGSHFYTASVAEKNDVVAKYPTIYSLDGPAYQVSSAFSTPLYRFYNKKNGSHFYTASEAEKNNVVAKYSSTYQLDGVAYKVSAVPAAGTVPVYRFYNRKNGSHFYTASEAEKNTVISTLGATYALDGPAFHVVP